MSFIFELLFELIFDSTIDIARNTKVPKWARFPAIMVISALVLGVAVAVGFAGVALIRDHEDSAQLAAGTLFLVLDAVYVISIVKNTVKQIKKHSLRTDRNEK